MGVQVNWPEYKSVEDVVCTQMVVSKSSLAGGKMTVFKKLKLLLWKNFILKKRKTLITLFEILMPLLFSAIVLYLRFNSTPKQIPTTKYQTVDISLLPVYFYKYPLKSKYQLAYIPSKSETLKAVTEMVEQTFAVDFEGQI
ncbi:ATP-binding cassette sub-family A member 17 isoform X1 [Sigmodon hispidus]